MTREEAIDKLKRWRRDVDDEKEYPEYSEGWFYKDDEIAFDMAIEALEEQKTGKWVYKTTDAYIQRTCSACGWSERMYYRNRNQDGLIRNYCPNCGAYMGGVIDGKENDNNESDYSS